MPRTDRTPADLLVLFSELRAFLDAAYPGYRSARLVVELADGQSAALPVPPGCPCGPARAEEGAELSALEAALCDVLDPLGVEDALTGEQVAIRAGRELNGGLWGALSRLKKAQRIRHASGRGYYGAG